MMSVRNLLNWFSDSLVGNAGVQLAARIYTSAAQLLVYGLLGVAGSDNVLAGYAVGMAAAGLVSTAVDAGSGLWVIREVSDGRNLPRLFVPRLVMVVLCGLALVGASFGGLIPFNALPWVLLIGAMVGIGRFWRGVLWARLRYVQDSLASTAETTVLVVGVVLAILLSSDDASMSLLAAAIAYGFGYVLRRAIARRLVDLRGDRTTFRDWIARVYSYGGQAAVTSAQVQADVLLLGAIWAGPASGIAAYALAMRFYYALGMPFEALGTAILPRVALGLRIDWRKILGIGVPSGLVGLAAMYVLTTFGHLLGFTPATSHYLRDLGLVLVLALPFRFSSYILGAVVTGSGNQSLRFRSAAIGLATMLILDVLLIPDSGPMGAAIALVCADVALALGYGWAARQAGR